MLPTLLKDRGPYWGLALVLGLLIVMLARKADEPLREYGAGHTQDAEWLLAGERFEKDGLAKTRWVPFKQIGPLEDAPLGKEYPYLHGYMLHFAMGKTLRGLGINSPAGFRMWAASVYVLGLVCLFWLVAQTAGSRWLALLATSLVAFSNPLYAHADSMAWYSQVLFFVFAPLALWMHSVRHPETRLWAWWGVGALFALQSLFIMAAAYPLYSHAFLWLYALLLGIPRPKRRLLWLLGGHAAGISLLLARNAWYLGVKDALRDIGGTILWRIADIHALGMESVSEESPASLAVPSWDFSIYLWIVLKRLSRTFVGFRGMLGLVVFLGLVAVAAYRIMKAAPARPGRREEKFRRTFLLGLALLLAAAPFALIFQQNVVTHHFTGVDYIPGVAVLLAAFVWRLSWTRRKLAIALACVFVLASVADCRRKEIQHPGHFGAARQIHERLPEGAVVGISSGTIALSYYIHRPFVRHLQTPDAVEDFHRRARGQFPDRPLHFVLSPDMELPHEPLRMHLDARYPLVMEIEERGLRVYQLSALAPESKAGLDKVERPLLCSPSA
jgi:hypothetical protein